MATTTPSILFTLLFFVIISGGMMKVTKGKVLLDQPIWCIATPAITSDEALQNNIDYACAHLGNCSIISPGGECFEPNTLISRASVVMNLYYQQNNKYDCRLFNKSGLAVVTDPSYGKCKYSTNFVENFFDNQRNGYCVARPSTSDEVLQNNIDYACARLGNCSIISPGGDCFEPSTLISRASVVMNLYYRQNNKSDCDFNGSGLVTDGNPSYDRIHCDYYVPQD